MARRLRRTAARAEPEPRDLEERLRRALVDLHEARLEIKEHKRELQLAAAAIREKDVKLAQAERELAILLQKNAELAKALDELTKARARMKVEDLARHFQQAIELINEEARKKGREGKAHFMVGDFEVEVKGGLDLRDGVHLTQLHLQELSAQTVSTIRIALKPVPVIRIADE